MGDDFAFGHCCGEVVGGYDGAVVVAVAFSSSGGIVMGSYRSARLLSGYNALASRIA